MSPEPAEITLREVYDIVQELKFELAHIPRIADDHEKRIRNLERLIWSLSGVATLLGAGLSQLITVLNK
jgi:hypothetical protein